MSRALARGASMKSVAENIVPFPPAPILPLRRVRSGLLCSSIQSLRDRKLYDRYLELLPKEHANAILSLTAFEWIEPKLAFVHYEACDALGLDITDQVEIGMRVAQQLQRGFLSVALRFATEAGVTPWAVLQRTPKLWERYFEGSSVAVWKLGPKEARVEFAGFPLARIGYIKNGVGGIVRGVTELVCKRVYVVPLTKHCSDTTLGYRLSWA
jgi:hypothetical protein